MTPSEAYEKLCKEINAATQDKQPYVVLPLDVAKALEDVVGGDLENT